jgi:uncharacterized protein
MMYLDLDELGNLFSKNWFWSSSKPSIAWFRRADHLGDPGTNLKMAVKDRVEECTGWRPSGPIRLLTHLRYFGYGFSPVSFYYCFDDQGVDVLALLAEVNNTPWGEQHTYVVNAADGISKITSTDLRLQKEFHVSPFMPMNMQYKWHLSRPEQQLTLHMISSIESKNVFDATLRLSRKEITNRLLAITLFRFPVITLKIVIGIYYQAFKLWFKRVPIHAHPAGK